MCVFLTVTFYCSQNTEVIPVVLLTTDSHTTTQCNHSLLTLTNTPPPKASSMMEPCVTPAVNNPSLVFAGNVLNAPITISALLVTMETSITLDTGSTGSPPQAARG